MRKHLGILLALLLLLGCAPPEPIEHPDWADDWFRMGDVVAAETPDGFALNESNDVLSIAGLYYATWTAGEGEPITNAQGSDALLYDAQIYLLVKECDSVEEANANVSDWMRRETGSYAAEHTALTIGGREWNVLILQEALSENPYAGGAAAFIAVGTNAISVELLCRPDWDGDTEAVLTTFLSGLHFA